MTSFEVSLKNIDNFCKEQKIHFSIIGGIALIFYKIQRTTYDIDITLLVELDNIKSMGNIIIKNFKPIFNNPIEFFERNFILPVTDKSTNIRIDFAAGLTGFDKSVVERSKRKKFGNLFLPFCTLEDLILYKLFAARPKDIADLYDISKMHKHNLDKKYLNKMLNSFLEFERKDMKEYFKKIFK